MYLTKPKKIHNPSNFSWCSTVHAKQTFWLYAFFSESWIPQKTSFRSLFMSLCRLLSWIMLSYVWEICKCDFKLPNGDAVMWKERVHLWEKKSQYELRASILQGLGLTSLCPALVKKLAISIRNLHLHASPLLIMDISHIKSSFHSTLQKTTPTASLTVNVKAPSAFL